MMIKDLKDGDHIVSQYVIVNFAKCVTTAGKNYLNLTLQDSTGSIDGKKWDVNEEDLDTFLSGNIVSIEKKDLKNITLAYAITIHKSQGSEFEHVIMPICNNYSIMLYNKLIYTAVSRAKKSLTIIGEPSAFIRAVNNNYSMMRKTSLIEYLNKYYNV